MKRHARHHEMVAAQNFGHLVDDVCIQPANRAPTTTTEATPMMMPIKVRKARSLWAKID
jgi:hypothetical protein